MKTATPQSQSQPQPVKSPDRLTIIEQVYHRSKGFDPFTYSLRFNTKLHCSESEQAFQRRYIVGTEWETVSHGWVESPKYLWVENHGADPLNVQPTPEVAAERANRIIEISYRNEPDWLVYPGEAIRVCPSTLDGLMIRSRDEPTRITITIVQG